MSSRSFQKKSKTRFLSIPGTKPSVQNLQLLTSSGIPSLDVLFGGGLPVGSVILLEEDTYNLYSDIFLKLFLSEGLANDHYIYVSSLDKKPSKIIKELPSLSNSQILKPEHDDEKMKIAWRYQENKSMGNEDISNKFDISKSMNIDVHDKRIIEWSPETDSKISSDAISIENHNFCSLLYSLKQNISKLNLIPSLNKTESNMMRIAIQSIFSPLWLSNLGMTEDFRSLTQFLVALKSVVRSSFSVALITIPSHLLEEDSVMTRLYNIVDFSIKLESFQGSSKEKNPIFKDFHGLVHINKIAPLNTITPQNIDSHDWAFYMKKKSISIKKLHLPPDLSETASRSDGNASKQALTNKVSCAGPVLPRNLDF